VTDASPPDRALVAAAVDGDRDAVEQLLRRHFDSIAGLCRRMCGNKADGDDATQEALLAVVRGLPRFDGRAAFSTWVYRVATNACLDELRRRKRRPLPSEKMVEARTSDLADGVTARLDVDRGLSELPLEFRTAVVLRDLCGLDYAEIADVLDVPVGTVRSRIARGRAGLANVLGNPEPPAERLSP
jgi:RNA polymerase sigma-70 factor (ECF subfamily)